MPSTGEVLARIAALGRTASSSKLVRERVVAHLRRAVDFDAYVFGLTDPVTRIITSPLADVPGLPWPRLPELIRWRYLTAVNRWDVLLDAGVRAGSLLGLTDGQPERAPVWRTVQQGLGVVDTATLVFGDRFGCWGMLDLWRTRNCFTSRDLDVLAQLPPVVTPILRTAVQRTFLEDAAAATSVGPAVVMLGPDLLVKGTTAAAERALLELNPPGDLTAPVPAAAYNVAAALVAQENGVPLSDPWARAHLEGTGWVTVRASRIGEDVAVTIEPPTAAERLDLFARAHALSPRESEVLALLVGGQAPKEITGQLVLSEHTVNDHIKAVLAKAGCRTRHVLVARALGSARPGG